MLAEYLVNLIDWHIQQPSNLSLIFGDNYLQGTVCDMQKIA